MPRKQYFVNVGIRQCLVVAETGTEPADDFYDMPRLAKTGILIESSTSPKITAAANSQAITRGGNGAIAIPRTASIEMIRRSAIEDSTTHFVGRNSHRCPRDRIA
jgi:3-deoxy-D-manno-octulosonate 8-phosphate phosphatase KdsC-like HAD superfamily phosphatase